MIKKIISYIFVFLLILVLVGTVSLTIINQTILKKEFIIKMLEKNEYYSAIHQEIKENFINNTVQTGLEEDVLDGVITEEIVKNDVNSFIYYLYGEGEMSLTTSSIKEKLQDNINEVVKQNKKNVTESEQTAIDTYVNNIVEIYQNGIVYADKYVEPIHQVVQEAQKIIQMAQITGYIVVAALCVILLAINKSSVLKYLSIGMMCVGILLVAPKIIEVSTMQIHNILLFNLAFSKVLIHSIETVISYFMITGIVMFIIGFIINIVFAKIAKKMSEDDQT